MKQKCSEVIIVFVDPSALKLQKITPNPKFSFLEFSRGINLPFSKAPCSVKCKVFKLFPSVERPFYSEFQRIVEV